MIGNEDKELRTDIHHMDKLISMSQVTLLCSYAWPGLLPHRQFTSICTAFMCSWHTLRQLVEKQ